MDPIANGRLRDLAPYPVHPNELKANGHANGRAPAKPKASKAATGRFQILNTFIDHAMGELTRSEVTAWLVLFRCTDARNNTAQATIETIAERIGTSKQHTLKAIAKLTERGFLERLKMGGINRGSSVYRVHPMPKTATRTGNP